MNRDNQWIISMIYISINYEIQFQKSINFMYQYFFNSIPKANKFNVYILTFSLFFKISECELILFVRR